MKVFLPAATVSLADKLIPDRKCLAASPFCKTVTSQSDGGSTGTFGSDQQIVVIMARIMTGSALFEKYSRHWCAIYSRQPNVRNGRGLRGCPCDPIVPRPQVTHPFIGMCGRRHVTNRAVRGQDPCARSGPMCDPAEGWSDSCSWNGPGAFIGKG